MGFDGAFPDVCAVSIRAKVPSALSIVTQLVLGVKFPSRPVLIRQYGDLDIKPSGSGRFIDLLSFKKK